MDRRDLLGRVSKVFDPSRSGFGVRVVDLLPSALRRVPGVLDCHSEVPFPSGLQSCEPLVRTGVTTPP